MPSSTPAPGGTGSSFSPGTSVQLCNALLNTFADPQLAGNPGCLDVLGNGVTSNTSITLDLPSTDLNFSRQVTLVPSSVSIAGGGSIPAGTKIGGVHEVSTLGIANATCSSVQTTDVVLFNVALPNNPGSPLASSNLAYPRAAGTLNRFGGWAIGATASSPGGISFGVDGGHAGGTSVAVQNYPRYLLDAFNSLVPTAAYGGLTQVQGEWQPYYLLQFSPGQLQALPSPYSLLNAAMGQPLVRVTGDPTAVPSISAITDTCSPSSSVTMLLGKDPTATYTRATSPITPETTAYYMQYLSSVRDTDQDGFENTLDTCPLSPDAGSPKSGGGDTDLDGIDAACDVSLFNGADVDGDGYFNREDNCPLLSNSSQADSEPASTTDGGPQKDGIGDSCDNGVIAVTQNGQAVSISMSSAVANGRYMSVTNVEPKCFGGTDVDGDGYCATSDNAEAGGCGGGCSVRHAQWFGSTDPKLQMDSDGDFTAITGVWSDAAEAYLGTDATKPCAQTSAPNDEGPFDNWPLDMDDNQRVTGSDLLKYNTVLAPGNRAVNQGGNGDGTATTPATIAVPLMGTVSQARFDLTLDGFLNGADVLKLNPFFGKICGSAGAPPLTLGPAFQR